MERKCPQLIALVGIGVAVLLAASPLAQQTAKMETKQFEIVAVDGNRVVVKGDTGAAQEVIVNDDFRLTVDGKPISVKELKPGMKGTATITTTTTTRPVYVTEVRNGEILQRSGNSIIVRTADGIRMFSESEVEKRGIRIMRDGKQAEFSSLSTGDRLSATIVTPGPPQTITERDVQAAIKSAPAAAAAAASASSANRTASASTAAGAASATGTGGAGASAGRQLPRTASPLPLVGLIGAVSVGLGALLTALRLRR